MSLIYQKWKISGTINPFAFADLSWTQIKQACDAGLADDYIAAGTWNIGDINKSVNYGSYTGGIQLVHCLTDTQRGSSYYNTNGHIVIQFVNTIATSTYMPSPGVQKYFEGALHTCCNTTIYSGLDSTFKTLLEPWSCYVGKENATTSSISGVYTQTVYLAEPSIKELGGSNNYNTDENNTCFVLDYFSNSSTAESRRVKDGADSYWWSRSPSYADSYYNEYYAHAILSDGYISDDYSVCSYVFSNNFGVAPIGVI